MERGVVVVLGKSLLRNVQLFLGTGALPPGVLAIQFVIPAFTRHIEQRRGRAKWKQHHGRSARRGARHGAWCCSRSWQKPAPQRPIVPWHGCAATWRSGHTDRKSTRLNSSHLG